MLTKREVVAIKVESTYNTDAVPTATDAVLVENAQLSFEGARMVERAPVKPTLGKEKSIHAGNLAQITFEAEIKGSGSAGTAPELGQALRGCGLAETIVASTSVTYQPASSSLESVTIYYYQDGVRHVITGARGTVEFTLNAGEIGKASFTFTGHHASTTDVGLITPTYDSTVPAPAINTSFSVGGYAAAISALALSLNNEVVTPVSLGASDGYGEIRIADRDVSGSFDPEYTLIATKDWVTEWKNGTNQAISTGNIGSAGNQYSFSIPTAYYRDLSQGDRDGVRTLEIGYGAAGDDAAFDLVFS